MLVFLLQLDKVEFGIWDRLVDPPCLRIEGIGLWELRY